MSTASKTEVRGLIRHRARPNRTGSGNFHPLAQKVKRKLAIAGTPMPSALISENLWALSKSGVLARLSMEAEGWSKSEDPTAWDALLNIMKAQAA